jgi:FkbM family methyltransferase
MGHERLLRLERLRKRNALARAAIAPARWWLRRGSIRVTGGLGFGLRMSLAHLPMSHAHAGALPHGWLEVSVQEALRRLLGEGKVFCDIGANVGFFSLIGSRLVGDSGRVYAFEPAPGNAAAIRENIGLNGMHNAEVIESAVGAEPGREKLLLVEDLSWSHLESQGWHPRTSTTLEVDVVTIDQLVAEGRIRPPDVVKIDVEGSEIDVIHGMRETLTRHKPTLVCELHETNDAFLAAMEEVGYRAVNLEGPESLSGAPMSVHALAEPRDS